ncbi:glycosyl hydrolase 115 family protein [Butyrivibrio sp. AE3004]|uniref:glycosyl hydrolase 115 family protein n=1 Tax=Butyrivibrio sp. AE3004 TaxID=1506994 RepID=UPI000493DE2E|nr:glycosyl hydrolase 115 family protein [Butyrivibrio sp. AE3004]
MKKFNLVSNNKAVNILIEDSSFEGVKLIGNTLAEDIKAVTDTDSLFFTNAKECVAKELIIIATLGKSDIVPCFERNGKLRTQDIAGKKEVFMMQIVDEPFAGEDFFVEKALVIVGSDKRGTIYGMFHLSEMLGVSPLIYFGDVIPHKNPNPEIILDDIVVSKEPSVEYRGFFINDEWPAFGNWTLEKFGGVNAKAYRKIFELLLRLKGNYLWPAMWNSSFSEDGPGLSNAILADKLGIIMGTSHHEPLCRAGIEWQNKYKEYGNDSTWSFLSNEEAITKFWEDGLRRNKDYENIITIGMRGEADSKLLPEDSTLKDNIDVIKKVVKVQNSLIKQYVCEELENVPRMLAIYKEVEDYYYGDDSCEGLKDWDELSDVIFLLSDDNHGNLRNLPTYDERKHPGGYGMYYHFDYHGAPISYEWTNCNRLTKIWEQMTFAYEAGVRKMWIVNVGDLKEMEYPLSYFMELAYDFEKWGTSAPNMTETYAKLWIEKQFGSYITELQKEKIFKVLEGYTRWNAARTPETMNENIYHPVNYRECDRVMRSVNEILSIAEGLNEELRNEARLAYQSMIYYGAAASLNLVLAWCETALNHEYARRGYIYANILAKSVEKRIAKDREYIEEFHKFNGGKWNHCLSSAHTGFKSWDDRDWTYPVVHIVSPISVAKASVSFRGSEKFHLGAYWQDMAPLFNDELTRIDCEEIMLDLDSKGFVDFDYKIACDAEYITFDKYNGHVCVGETGRETVIIKAKKDELSGIKTAKVRVDIEFKNGQKTYVNLEIIVEGTAKDISATGSKIFAEKQGYISINANDFTEKKDTKDGSFEVVDYLGREGSAIKVLPPAIHFKDWETAPFIKYNVFVNNSDEYTLSLYLLTRNPSERGGRIRFYMGTGEVKPFELCAVSDHYYTEWQDDEWAQGVLTGGRVVKHNILLHEGENSIYIYASDPEFILEKLVICEKGKELKKTYFGPASFVL